MVLKSPIPLAVIAIIIACIAVFYGDSIIPHSPKVDSQDALSLEERNVLDSSLDVLDSHPHIYSRMLNDTNVRNLMHEELLELNESLDKDPYDVQALIIRGTSYFVIGDYRNSIKDFNEAIKNDKEISDPHIGLGTIYYHLALIDMINRGNYNIVGYYREYIPILDSYINYPDVELYPDYRDKILLNLALKELNTANSLEQHYDRKSNGTLVFFPSDYTNEKLDAVRFLLGMTPTDNGDISKTFLELNLYYFPETYSAMHDGSPSGIMEPVKDIEIEKIEEIAQCETELYNTIHGVANEKIGNEYLSITIFSCNQSQFAVNGPYVGEKFYKFTAIPGQKFVIISFKFLNTGLTPLVTPYISRGDIETDKGFLYPIWIPPKGLHSDEYHPIEATQDEIDALVGRSGAYETLLPNQSIKGGLVFELPHDEEPVGMYLEHVPCKILIRD